MHSADRFWALVDRSAPDGCWPWIGAKDPHGYGHLKRRRTEQILAHRMAFFLTHGRWPTPLCLHTCHDRSCCRPEHLYEGSHADNMRDMVASGRVGHGRHLSAPNVSAIRALAGSMTRAAIAETFGVSRSCVKKILNGERHPLTP